MSFKTYLTNFQNIGASNTATLKCPVGRDAPTMDKIIISLAGGLTPAMILGTQAKANGQLILDEGSGTRLNQRDTYRGIYNEASHLCLDFTEPGARNGAVEQLLASVPMNLLQDLTFEFRLSADVPAGARMEAQLIGRRPTNNPFIRKLFNTTQSYSAGGEQIIFLPVGNAGGKVKRIWIHEATPGTITSMNIRVGNTVAHEVKRAQLEYEQKRNQLVPQAGMVVLDFIEDGNLSGVLDTGRAGNVELRLSSSAANTYTVYYEYIDPLK
jgi:hypothetical protein